MNQFFVDTSCIEGGYALNLNYGPPSHFHSSLSTVTDRWCCEHTESGVWTFVNGAYKSFGVAKAMKETPARVSSMMDMLHKHVTAKHAAKFVVCTMHTGPEASVRIISTDEDVAESILKWIKSYLFFHVDHADALMQMFPYEYSGNLLAIDDFIVDRKNLRVTMPRGSFILRGYADSPDLRQGMMFSGSSYQFRKVGISSVLFVQPFESFVDIKSIRNVPPLLSKSLDYAAAFNHNHRPFVLVVVFDGYTNQFRFTTNSARAASDAKRWLIQHLHHLNKTRHDSCADKSHFLAQSAWAQKAID